MGKEIEVVAEEQGLFYLIRIKGEFRAATLMEVRKAVDEATSAGHNKIIFELSETGFVDSSGLGLIANVHKRMLANSGKVVVSGPSFPVQQSLAATRLRDVIGVFNNLQQAEANLT